MVAVLEAMCSIAVGRERERAMKELMYSLSQHRSRLGANDESVSFRLSESVSVPTYLRRKPAKGKGDVSVGIASADSASRTEIGIGLRTPSLELNNIEIRTKNLPSQRHKVIVVRQKDDLHVAREVAKDFQPCCRAPIVKVDEKVVCDERHVQSLFDLKLKRRESERQVKLIARPLAHPGHIDLLPIRADAEKTRCGIL